MAYEYAAQEAAVVSALAHILRMTSDGIDDKQQILQYTADMAAVLSQVQQVMSAEQKAIFRAKFWVYVLADVMKKAANQFIVDEPNL